MNNQIILLLKDNKESVVRFVMDESLKKNIGKVDLAPELFERDVNYILDYLIQSAELNSPLLFADFTAWLTELLINLRIEPDHLRMSYDFIREGIANFTGDTNALNDYFTSANKSFIRSTPREMETILPSENEILGKYVRYLIKSNRNQARNLIMDAFHSGMKIQNIYMDVFAPAQRMVGYLWQSNNISVAQEHYATAVTQLIMSELYPYIFQNSQNNGYKMAGFAIGSELHELAIRMVTDFFEMDGWDTSFYGSNMPAFSIINLLDQDNYNLLALSVTMMIHLNQLKECIRQIRNQDRFNNVKILVGGNPFNVDPDLWKTLGADGTAQNAELAIHHANKWFNLS
ncbi:MAG TPA: cobalamin-binding protein [Candidatus Marinimicrobia bacterium]|mgnify:CR=1 FL=1|nr:cobalamin-binding protein [Candidatus Neomarinimicrobiota bacterium]